MSKRLFDIAFAVLGLLVTAPLFVLIAAAVAIASKGPVFFLQRRVGRNQRDFSIYKFRTMYRDAESRGQLTVGTRDSRITAVGYWLRRFKLDELPQLLNVLMGQMSVVGPRPEVRKYVQLYTDQEKKVLSVLPGITDLASIHFINENEILSRFANPEEAYIRQIMPVKLGYNLQYLQDRSFFTDLSIIGQTLFRILGINKKRFT